MQKMVEFGDSRMPEKFWQRIAIKHAGYSTSCWAWLGALNRSGYGAFNFGGLKTSVHRMAYHFMVKEVPANLVIDHLCRNRACVNPNHLQAVTQAENLRTAIGLGEKGMVFLAERNKISKAKTHCPRGHSYSVENTYLEERGTFQSRHCKTCRDDRLRKLRDSGYFKEHHRKSKEVSK